MMEPLTLKPRQPQEEDLECWDDDEDLQGDEFHFRTASVATSATTASTQHFHTRDSISSRMSMQSDAEVHHGGDEDRQVHLPGDDAESTGDAIASAIRAGIPIPKNVPSSALVGGTIKRLGGKRSKKVQGDDWSEDLELPAMDGRLTIKKKDATSFPDTFRQFSAEFAKLQTKDQGGLSFADRMKAAKPSGGTGKLDQSRLDRFRDPDATAADDDFFGDGSAVPTIKLAKSRSPRKPFVFPSQVGPPAEEAVVDDFENDLELPEDGEPLRLSTRKEIPKTPATAQADFEEWAEGSLGTRYGGTKRDGRSNRSSSFSAMSPSVSSSFTVESEDEGLDGLVLPEGPLNLDEVLSKKRQQTVSPEPADFSGEQQHQQPQRLPEEKRVAQKDDFFSGLEIGDGAVFDSGKLTLNRNVKHKAIKPTSPTRRTAMTLTFTNKPAAAVQTRIPKLKGAQERGPPALALEPVSEGSSGAPTSRRAPSRLSGHSAHSSTSSIPTPLTPSRATAPVPSTPSRTQNNLGTKPSIKALRPEPTTTSAQLLKMKRSMPTMTSPKKANTPSTNYQPRPPSRSDAAQRSNLPTRPKTPTERSESSLGHRKPSGAIPPVPFLPAGGTAHSKSHHISVKTSRTFRRHDSESSVDNRPSSRASRATARSPSPVHRGRTRPPLLAPEHLAREAAAKRTLTRPKKGRNFGDGNELEVFDDLPTSASNESKFVKVPIGRGAPKTIRSKLGLQPLPLADRSETPTPAGPLRSPTKAHYPLDHNSTPRFARDTNASRIAREQRTGGPAVPPPTAPLASTTTNWKSSQLTARTPTHLAPATASVRSKRRHAGGVQPPQLKPHLIKPLGDTHNNAKQVKGMQYNPSLFRWEGNENALAPFDPPLFSPSTSTAPHAHHHHPPLSHPSTTLPPTAAPTTHSTSSKPHDPPAQRPALITNVSSLSSPTVKVVGGMVFDPQRMCWLKLSHHPSTRQSHGRSRPGSSAGPQEDDDSDDPFAGLDDLEDRKTAAVAPADPSTAARPSLGRTDSKPSAASASQHAESTAKSGGVAGGDEWLVGEEFDVGPEFVRRQREEEARWRRKVEPWVGGVGIGLERENDDWRWSIRDVLFGNTAVAATASAAPAQR